MSSEQQFQSLRESVCLPLPIYAGNKVICRQITGYIYIYTTCVGDYILIYICVSESVIVYVHCVCS